MSSILAAIYIPTGEDAGTIRRRVLCSPSQIGAQVRDGEALLEVPRGTVFNDLTHCIDLSGPAPILAPKQ